MSKFRQTSDPQTFELEKPLNGRNVVLGLDLGTNCGYCFGYYDNDKGPIILPYHMGQWDLSAGSYDSGAIRFLRLRQFLIAVQPSAVFYENVKFTPAEAITRYSAARVLARTATSSELIGAFRATVVTLCEELNIPCTGFAVKEIKKRATGKGNANKEDMIKACNELFKTDFDPETYEQTGVDNIADAAFVCLLGLEIYGKGFES